MAYLIDVKIEYLEKFLHEYRKDLHDLKTEKEKLPWWAVQTRSDLNHDIATKEGLINGINVAIDVLKDKSITNNPHGEGSTISRRAPQHQKRNR